MAFLSTEEQGKIIGCAHRFENEHFRNVSFTNNERTSETGELVLLFVEPWMPDNAFHHNIFPSQQKGKLEILAELPT